MVKEYRVDFVVQYEYNTTVNGSHQKQLTIDKKEVSNKSVLPELQCRLLQVGKPWVH